MTIGNPVNSHLVRQDDVHPVELTAIPKTTESPSVQTLLAKSRRGLSM